MLESAPPLVLWAIPAFVLLIAVEAWSEFRDPTNGVAYDVRDAGTSIGLGLGYVGVSLVWKFVDMAAYTLVWSLTPLDLGWGVAVWVFVVFADDLLYYWYHRMHHEVRLLWASHLVHHSSERYNLTTALRQPWTPFVGFVFWLPLALLGVHPLLIVTAQAWNLLYQFWIHTERIDRLHPWAELVLNTPSHHRVHHAVNPQYIDKNYGGILIVWDRLFGTFEPEVERPRYGLTTNVGSFNPVTVAFFEWRNIARDLRLAAGWRDRAGFLLRGPGWAYLRRAELAGTGEDTVPAA